MSSSGSDENPVTHCLRFICSKLKPARPSLPPPQPPQPPQPQPQQQPNPTSSMADGDDGIKHTTLKVNGINMHVAEKGEGGGPVVLLIHGFPDLWYTWRHQMHALSALGYRAVAPDMRGYGETDAPAGAEHYSYFHTVGDMVALIDAVAGGGKVFVVAHDWGALVAWHLCLFRPDKVRALVALSVPFPARNPTVKPIQALRAAYGDDYYVCRFQVPGEIEGEIEEAGGASKHLSKFLSYRDRGPLFLPKGNAFNGDYPLPLWLSDDEFAYYVHKYQHKGFTGGLNYYRAVDLNWELTAAWTGAQVKVPAKFIVGDVDLTYNAKGAQAYIHDAANGMKKYVPFLEEVVVLPGVGHFLQQENPTQVTRHIAQFISKF